MSMDKEWMKTKDRGAKAFLEGIDGFLNFAYANCNTNDGSNNGGTIRCPCCRCANVHFKIRSEVRFDLLKFGFLQSYILWDKHGEKHNALSRESEAIVDGDEDMLDMLQV